MEFNKFRDQTVLDVFNTFENCFYKTVNGYELIDPFENNAIGYHYGETHFSVALIIYGTLHNNPSIYSVGTGLLSDFMVNIDKYQKVKDYHWDFNNMAICVLIEFLEKNKTIKFPYEIDELKTFILSQQDSAHGTINWQPMRAYVNRCKYSWTNHRQFFDKANGYIKNVESAKYLDGFYEDFLPKGKSFNFQYHIYTTAMLSFLSRRMPEVLNPLEGIIRCTDIIDVDGDINFLGRGCNQIFAWGPIMYILNSNNMDRELANVSGYFSKKISEALSNRNLILNNSPGEEKKWWWDYHYSTVYYGHLIFWLMLTSLDEPITSKEIACTYQNLYGDSGVTILRTSNSFLCTFGGRKHYLAERGPVIANIGINGIGTIFKGPLGPYKGMFGNKYANYITTVENYMGPIARNIFCGKVTEKNIFPKKLISQIKENKICVEFDLGKKTKNIYFSVPLLCSESDIVVEIQADGKPVKLIKIGCYIGPYGETKRLETRKLECRFIKLEISGR